MNTDVEADYGRFSISGERLRQARIEAGLTQAALAEKAGYSDRLIRKAESGGRLNCETLSDILMALRESGSGVERDDLIVDPIYIAKVIVCQLDSLGRAMISHSEHLFSGSFEFECAGEATSMPFAGTFSGFKGMQDWLNLFHSTLDCIYDSQSSVSYFQNSNEVVARYSEQLGCKQQPTKEVWVNLHFAIERGKIQRMRKEYDTLVVAQLIAFAQTIACNNGVNIGSTPGFIPASALPWTNQVVKHAVDVAKKQKLLTKVVSIKDGTKHGSQSRPA